MLQCPHAMLRHSRSSRQTAAVLVAPAVVVRFEYSRDCTMRGEYAQAVIIRVPSGAAYDYRFAVHAASSVSVTPGPAARARRRAAAQ